jgi:hypothetical protein
MLNTGKSDYGHMSARDAKSGVRARTDHRDTVRRRSFLAGVGVAGASLLAGCTFNVDSDGLSVSDGNASVSCVRDGNSVTCESDEVTTPTEVPEFELAPVSDPEIAPVDQDIEVITPEPPTPTPTPAPRPTRYRIYNVTIVVDEASDGSGPFADSELELVGWVFVRGYDARSGRWIRAEGADQFNQVGTLASRRSALPMRAGERRRLNVDTVVEFPAGEPLDARSFISVGATLLEDDDGFNNSDQLGSYADGYEYRWRPANGGPGGEVLYREGDSRVRLLFRAEQVA